MANVWLAKDGDNPTQGEKPSYTLSLDDCTNKLGLAQEQFLSVLSTVPKFGEPGDPMADIRGYQHVVVVVDEDEAKDHGWRPGFYRSPVSPSRPSIALVPRASPGTEAGCTPSQFCETDPPP